MKKRNVLIVGVFVVLIIGYYLFNFFKDKEVIEEKEILVSNQTSDEMIIVYLTGEVYRKGNFSVPVDWNLGMLLEYVGLKETACINSLDLNQKLVNEQTYNIPSKENLYIDSKININTCSIEELKTIKGIGDVLATKIIAYRESNIFKSIEDIKNVSGIGEAMYEKIKHYITV